MSRIDDLLAKFEMVKPSYGKTDDWMARCPAHKDNSPSLHITVAENKILLNCFAGCTTDSVLEAAGATIDQLFMGDSPRLRNRVPKPSYVLPDKDPNDYFISESLIAWLATRGIREETARDLGVYGSAASVKFPIYHNDQLVNIKERINKSDGKKTFTQVDGARPAPFNADSCEGAEAIIICEGELDVCTIHQAGFTSVLSVPNGANKGRNNLDWLNDVQQLFERAARVILAVDSDDVGQRLEVELIGRIGADRCLRVRWPEECNDANDTLRRYGDLVVSSCIRAAQPVPVEGIFRPEDFRDDYRFIYEHGLARGLSTGHTELDEFFTMVFPGISCWTGIPQSGKSEFIDDVLVRMVELHDLRAVYFSPESEPTEEHLSRLAEKMIGKPFFSGYRGQMSWEEADAALMWAQDRFSMIRCDEPTSDTLTRLIKAEVYRTGAKIIVIDPYNEIIHPDQRNDARYLEKNLRTWRRLAERHGLHIIIVNHPHQMRMDPVTKQYPPVDLYDLDGGAMWANKIGALVSIWRDRTDPRADVKVYIKKTKTRRVGRNGRVNFQFERATGRYTATGEKEEGG